MQRRGREPQMFSLSALDVLAMATGVFVLLLILLMPYYRNSLSAIAEAGRLKVEVAKVEAEAAAVNARANTDAAAAEALVAETAQLAASAAALEAEAAATRQAIPQVPKPVAPKAPPVPATAPRPQNAVVPELDLVFVIDTTSSMTPVVRNMAASMRSIVRILQRLVPSLRIGVVSYKDRDTGLPPVEILPLTPADSNTARIMAFLDQVSASPVGSQTPEEDVFLGLQAATNLPWRPTARQALIVMGDAAAHPDEVQPTYSLARAFIQRQPGRSISTLFIPTPTARMRGEIDRNFMQQLAVAGGGTFNDHTGSLIESVLLSLLL